MREGVEEMLVIDGKTGEGGGQILRTSLTLSMVTGTPFRIENIRANRRRPGLLRQHLTAVRAVEALGAEVAGAELGSSSVELRPDSVRGGALHFAVGSAGSVGLVFQTVLPVLLAAGEGACLTLQGGTHNAWAPPFDFIERVYLPALAKMGAEVSIELDRPGFHPAGGGCMTVEVAPCASLEPIELLERGPIVARRAVAIACQLSMDIAKRELQVVRNELEWEEHETELRWNGDAAGPGNAIFVEVDHGAGREMCIGFGERGVRAEKVARRAGGELKRYLASDAPVGARLADQLMVPMAIAGAGCFRTSHMTEHSRMNLDVIRRFLPVEVRTEEGPDGVLIEFNAV